MVRRTTHRLLPLALALLVATLTLLVGAGPAQAHTDLVSASPEPGSSTRTPPPEVRLGFSEALQAPGYLVVTAPSGIKIVQGEATVDKAEIFASADLTEVGVYTVAYRVVSADGHPVSGDYTFTVTAPASAGTSTPSTGTASSSADPGTPGSDDAGTADSGSSQNDSDDSFWSRHRLHVAWGVGFLAVAAALVWFERRRHS